MVHAEQLVALTRGAFKTGKTKDIGWRLDQLKQLYKLLNENETAIAEAERKDLRKAAFETVLTEISIVRSETSCAINNLKTWVKPDYPSKSFMQTMDTVYVQHEPYGVVLIMGAWNYPTQLLLAPLVGAIAAGNCAILKPSEVAEHTAELFSNLIPKYLDNECFPVFNGTIPETTELLKEKFDYIFYTGSSRVGRIVMEAAAKHLTPTTLELGGKSPVYLHKNSDVKLAASRIAWGRLINLGQSCVAPDYIMCDPEIKEDFVKALSNVITERFGNDPQESKDLARIINARQFNRLKGILDKTPKEKIVFGGKTDEDDKYIAPTIVNNCTLEDAVMSDELFGPIFPIMEVKGKEEAVDIINEFEKPLALYVFSNETQVVDYVLSNTSSGGATVNDTMLHMSGSNVPFGGVGSSGMGRYHGKYSFDTFSHHRTVLYRKQNMEMLVQSRYPPYTDANLKMSKYFVEEKPGRGYCSIQ